VSWCAVAALWRNGSPDGMLRTLARGVFVAAGVTLFLMPHVRSSAAVQSRQVRALERGFVAIKPRGTSFLQVPAELKSRIQAVSLSIATHAELNNMSGRSHHFLASAALAVRPAIGESRFREVLAMNRAAGVAKHSFPSPLLGGAPARWADAEEALAVALPPVADCGGDSRCSSLSTASARGKVDHIFLSDPWAKFTALRGARSPPVHASAVRRAAVAVVDVGVQKAPPCAIHATEMVPPVAGADTGAPTSLEGSSSTLAVVEKALLNLVDVMTRVVCKVEVLLVSLDARLAGCSSLPAAVEVVDVASVSCAVVSQEPVVTELEERIMRWAEQKFSKGTVGAESEVIQEIFVSSLQNEMAAFSKNVAARVGSLLMKYDEGIQIQLNKLQQEFLLLSPDEVVEVVPVSGAADFQGDGAAADLLIIASLARIFRGSGLARAFWKVGPVVFDEGGESDDGNEACDDEDSVFPFAGSAYDDAFADAIGHMSFEEWTAACGGGDPFGPDAGSPRCDYSGSVLKWQTCEEIDAEELELGSLFRGTDVAIVGAVDASSIAGAVEEVVSQDQVIPVRLGRGQ